MSTCGGWLPRTFLFRLGYYHESSMCAREKFYIVALLGRCFTVEVRGVSLPLPLRQARRRDGMVTPNHGRRTTWWDGVPRLRRRSCRAPRPTYRTWHAVCADCRADHSHSSARITVDINSTITTLFMKACHGNQGSMTCWCRVVGDTANIRLSNAGALFGGPNIRLKWSK